MSLVRSGPGNQLNFLFKIVYGRYRPTLERPRKRATKHGVNTLGRGRKVSGRRQRGRSNPVLLTNLAGNREVEWWSRSGSNRRPLECHSSALPTELRPHEWRGLRNIATALPGVNQCRPTPRANLLATADSRTPIGLPGESEYLRQPPARARRRSGKPSVLRLHHRRAHGHGPGRDARVVARSRRNERP